MTGKHEDYEGYRILSWFDSLKGAKWSVDSVEIQAPKYDQNRHEGVVDICIHSIKYKTFALKEEAEDYSITSGKEIIDSALK